MLDNIENTSPSVWPSDDYTRTPYEVYTSDDIFAQEQQKIFNGHTWVVAGSIFVVALLVISWLYGTIAGLDDSSRFTVMVEVSIQNIVVASLIAVTLLDRPELALFSAVYAPPMAIIILVLLVFRLRRLSRAETA